MTGNHPPQKRSEKYKEKRVFFCTPQTLDNDLESGRFSGEGISLVVVGKFD
jgi:ERCC4-related helicase